MLVTNAQRQIAESVPELLGTLPGWSDVSVAESNGDDFRVRATIQGKEIEFSLEVKSGAWRSEYMDKLRSQVGQGGKANVLASAWIPPKLAKSLREMGLSYLDTAGNIYLSFQGIYVFRETIGDPLVDLARKRPLGETFTPTATKVGLQLLFDTSLVTEPLRTVANKSGVSLPSAKEAMDAFKADGFVQDAGKKGKFFVNREEFFLKWVEGYNRRLRPKLELGKYSAASLFIEDLPVLEDGMACWGGDQAASKLAYSILSEECIVYIYGKPAPVLAQNRLRRDPQGNVELLDAAWGHHQESMPKVAPVFVVYADLIHTQDPRCREIAKQIFEQVIKARLNE